MTAIKNSYKNGEIVFCIDQSCYSEKITKRKEYKIKEIGTGTKKGKIRIKGDTGKLVWISVLNFSKENQPNVKRIIIDDEISNPFKDCIEVTVMFNNDTKGWFRVTTAKYIESMLLTKRLYLDRNTIVVLKITNEVIANSIAELDNSNRLFEILIPYK